MNGLWHWYYFLEPETNQFVMETNLPTLNLWQGLFQPEASYDERMKGYEWLWVKTLVPAGTLSHGWDL